jgi:hypothetical protein
MLALLLVAGVFFAGNAEAQGKPASPDAQNHPSRA